MKTPNPQPLSSRKRDLSFAFAPERELNAFRAAPRVNEDSAHPAASSCRPVHVYLVDHQERGEDSYTDDPIMGELEQAIELDRQQTFHAR